MIPTQSGLDIVQWTSNTNIPRKKVQRDDSETVHDWMKGTHPVFMVSSAEAAVLNLWFAISSLYLQHNMAGASLATDQLLQLDLCWQPVALLCNG